MPYMGMGAGWHVNRAASVVLIALRLHSRYHEVLFLNRLLTGASSSYTQFPVPCKPNLCALEASLEVVKREPLGMSIKAVMNITEVYTKVLFEVAPKIRIRK